MAPATPKKTTNYIEYKDGFPYAALTIPAELREKIGKRKYRKKLEAISPRKAQLEAASLVAGWKKEIALHKALLDTETKNPLLKIIMEALDLRKEFDEASEYSEEDGGDSEKELIREYIEGLALGKIQKQEGEKVASDFYRIATGDLTLLEPLFNEWSKYLVIEKYEAKTIDTYTKDAKLFVDQFVSMERVTGDSLDAWVLVLLDKGMTRNTLNNRVIKGIRNFWTYLKDRKQITKEQFNLILEATVKEKTTKAAKSSGGREAFTPTEVAKALNAIPKEDTQLQAVLTIGMYTGMRIEEICSLKAIDIANIEDIECINIKDAKTAKGNRKVPIHSNLLPLIDKLLETARGDAEEIPKDAYLISGLTLNKYGDRSNAVGKRFGRLKTSLGFDSKKVFHSVRHCVVTQLDRAGYRETAIADLVGHENASQTSRYSEGQEVSELKKMVESINYPPSKQ
ncbi:MAG: tyrosine-type recombinase/integrase [Polynucleobacter sp.]